MKVLITRQIPEEGINLLKKFPEIEIDWRQGAPLTHQEMCEAVKGCTAIIPVIPDKIDKEVIDSAGETLKIIATYTVGYDNVDINYAAQKGIYVANAPGHCVSEVAEHILALLLALSKSIIQANDFVRDGKYKYWDPMLFVGPDLCSKRLGIIGFGRIGQHLCKIARASLDMDVVYFDMKRNEEAEKELDVKYVELDELLKTSDFVSLNVNLTPLTKHFLDTPQFNIMKKSAYILNTSRGAVINERSLAQALEDGKIKGAALDVFENEPVVDPILIKHENVILTPHIASATTRSRCEMSEMAAQNVIDVLINKTAPTNLVNVIDPTKKN